MKTIHKRETHDENDPKSSNIHCAETYLCNCVYPLNNTLHLFHIFVFHYRKRTKRLEGLLQMCVSATQIGLDALWGAP